MSGGSKFELARLAEQTERYEDMREVRLIAADGNLKHAGDSSLQRVI